MRSDLQATFLLVAFDGVTFTPIVDEFDTFSGGGWSVDGKMYYPAGSLFAVNRGGKVEQDDNEITREWQPGRDDVLDARLKLLPNIPCRVTRHVRNSDMSVQAKPFAIADCVLIGRKPPEQDTQDAGDSVYTITLGPSGPPQ